MADDDSDEMIALIREAGIVGHGGAAFPTHVKIRSALGKVDTMIVNAAECEPYITSDHRVMLEYADDVIAGVRILLRIFSRIRCIIAVESNKPDAVEALRRAIGADNRIKIDTLRTKYPQGGEKQLIRAVTGREVPPGKLPADAGCVVFNVDTVAAVNRAFSQGLPDIQRVVTVSGSAITTPKNLLVRVGTPLSALVAACGGYREGAAENGHGRTDDGRGAVYGRGARHPRHERLPRLFGKRGPARGRTDVHPVRALRAGLPDAVASYVYVPVRLA